MIYTNTDADTAETSIPILILEEVLIRGPILIPGILPYNIPGMVTNYIGWSLIQKTTM